MDTRKTVCLRFYVNRTKYIIMLLIVNFLFQLTQICLF